MHYWIYCKHLVVGSQINLERIVVDLYLAVQYGITIIVLGIGGY